MLGSGSTVSTNFFIWLVYKKCVAMGAANTMAVFWKYLKWSFEACQQGSSWADYINIC
jgi:hypothetical protein